MAENIELHSFCVSTNNDSNNIEEYHEITIESPKESVVFSPKSLKVKQYDFFTRFDVKPVHKLGQRKKKRGSPNLMDIVNSELASAASAVTDNMIVSIRDQREIEQNSFLIRVPSLQSLLRKSHRLRLDYEYGWRRKESVNLSPIFQRILENGISNNYLTPVQYVDPVLLEDFLSEKQSDDNKGQDMFLDIVINNMKFVHHHLFTLEKILTLKMVEFYNEYNISQRKIKEIAKDISVNRETRDKVKQKLIKISPSKKNEIRFDPTVRKYKGKLLELKDQHVELLKNRRKLIHRIISLWSDIEMVRERNGKVTTPYILDIANKDLTKEKYEELLDDAYNTEFSDLLDKLEYEYVSKYLEYKEMKTDKNLGSSERKKLIKPQLQIDEETLKEKVDYIVKNLVSKDEIDIVLNKNEKILSNEVKSSKVLARYQYTLEIYVDSVFVCKSDTYSTTHVLIEDIKFCESFSVQILPKNEYVRIALLENDEEVSALTVDLKHVIRYKADFIKQKLIYKNLLIHPNKKCVGSGYNIKDVAKENNVRLKSSNLFEGNLETTCEITIKMVWNEKLNRSENELIKKSIETGRKLKRFLHGIEKPNLDELVDLICKIYGSDISNNEDIIQSLITMSKAKISNEFQFSINENQPDLIRLKLLHLRNIGGFVNIENKLVPLHASQISTEHLNLLQKSNDKDVGVGYINDKFEEMEPIELQRFIGCKYVDKLNRNMLKNLHDHLMKKTHKDVVCDYRDLSWRNIFSNQTNLMSLASLPKSTKQQYLNAALSKEQEIQITVMRAFNLMDRSSSILHEDDDGDDSTIAGFKVRPLRPYVRLSYHGTSAQTATAIGCHPTWNQTMKMRLKLTPLSILNVNIFDEYRININEGYSDDEASQGKTLHYRCSNKWLGTLQIPMHSVLTSGMLRGMFKIITPPIIFGYDVVQKKDATYSLIPEVTQLLKKDTSFIALQISTSLSHLGGLQAYNQPIPSSADDDVLIKHLNTVVTNYTNDFPTRNISLTFIDSSGRNKCVTQFLQPMPIPSTEYFPKNAKNRVESALSKSSGISKSSSSKSSGGRRKETDVEVQGERESLYSGFEGSWKGESQMVKMMNGCLRYVSLIPTYEVSESHVITLMGLELLKVLYGSPLDHTILLASYFLYLGIKCWVVVGQGLPRGVSSYVLTKYDTAARRDVLVTDQLFKSKGFFSKNDGYLWNLFDAVTGERYELRDVSSPLKTVEYVFDNENIWLNMQTSQDCESVSFDLMKSSNWMPVFDKTIFVMSQPSVTDPGLYSLPPDVTTLRDTLEAKIRVKVQKWRSQLKTIWNRYCSTLLREVLPAWEYWSFNPNDQKPSLSQRLKQLMTTYKIFGFPLNIPYANAKSVISTVKSTGLHLNDDPNVEYGLAVEVYAYPNNVLSVWIFLASITRI